MPATSHHERYRWCAAEFPAIAGAAIVLVVGFGTLLSTASMLGLFVNIATMPRHVVAIVTVRPRAHAPPAVVTPRPDGLALPLHNACHLPRPHTVTGRLPWHAEWLRRCDRLRCDGPRFLPPAARASCLRQRARRLGAVRCSHMSCSGRHVLLHDGVDAVGSVRRAELVSEATAIRLRGSCAGGGCRSGRRDRCRAERNSTHRTGLLGGCNRAVVRSIAATRARRFRAAMERGD